MPERWDNNSWKENYGRYSFLVHKERIPYLYSYAKEQGLKSINQLAEIIMRDLAEKIKKEKTAQRVI